MKNEDTGILLLHVAMESEKCHSLLKVTPRVHDRVKELAAKLRWQPIDVASALITYALDHVEISSTISSSSEPNVPPVDSALVDAVADEVMARLNLDSAKDRKENT